ncbi:MAG: NADP-dependent isocitrate dehydrogenase [Nitrososphaerota archaeon]|jgi:isocitrate dehydrogenase|nr:NADP-dependent isocitrate dehydrogenase [Nitrososphaerota archaeon]MDG6903742.1 NADP-dependent isocitrate dehydrogenase [Nitrososphaerota archaeon]MDG6912162.1 NADP-dependent isocitrate dehydrogenase [Nitrososphaerota archaeon]MDG6919842.1 NADP-dependent isocitrate dehydrogenase [Nitrososphaerota archaeon]MDG6924589.1 NADP-dependent isocitrate dehydrogenase [Nitrososphaerota archaeon]
MMANMNEAPGYHAIPITVAYGDGIGPEIMEATLGIINAGGASLAIETIQIGESVYHKGITAGIESSAWDSLRRTKVFLKAPITTPEGGGFKSLNVTVRKTLGLFANVRPCPAYAPFVATRHPDMDVVIIRENEEDVYGGIEHRQTDEVVQCLKLITRPGSERIIRYAFEYARRYGRHKVTCFTKDNIMKLTDGTFHKVFDEVASEYQDITSEHWIVDIGAAKLADSPEQFDVIVMPNLYGDILSDVAAQIAGSVGLAGSANIGSEVAMFEAVHGSAPRRAGQNVANPSGLLLAAVQMLVHIGQGDVAARVHNAWLKTIEDGIHTYDIYDPAVSKEKVGTREFAAAVIARLGKKPQALKAVEYPVHGSPITIKLKERPLPVKELVGIDIFVEWREAVELLGKRLEEHAGPDFQLVMITNRGTKVYPGGVAETFCVDHWRCRFQALHNGEPVAHEQVIALLSRLIAAGLPPIKTEGLFTFDGLPGFSLGQGQ